MLKMILISVVGAFNGLLYHAICVIYIPLRRSGSAESCVVGERMVLVSSENYYLNTLGILFKMCVL